jgi:hypothetical protein
MLGKNARSRVMLVGVLHVDNIVAFIIIWLEGRSGREVRTRTVDPSRSPLSTLTVSASPHVSLKCAIGDYRPLHSYPSQYPMKGKQEWKAVVGMGSKTNTP